MDKVELVIIGAGPAGLAASRIAARFNIDTLLVDEQRCAGGQIYRNIDRIDENVIDVLGANYRHGKTLLPVGGESTVHPTFETGVWNISSNAEIDLSGPDGSYRVEAGQIILATGAIERAMPFPGWTLPGVMTAGAMQVAMKSSGLVPAEPFVLAGSGPLLYLLATQIHDAGGNIKALIDSTPTSNRAAAIKRFGGLLCGGKLLIDGVKLLAGIRRRNIRHIKGADSLQAIGNKQLEQLAYTLNGQRHVLDCDAMAVHLGVVPNVQLTRLLGIEHRWQDDQHCWNPVSSYCGRTELPWLKLAGDGAGIHGAISAEIQGEMAAISASLDLSVIAPAMAESMLSQLYRRYRKSIRARAFVNALYAPSREFLLPADDTIVCRCEEVRAGDIRHYVDLGCRGPNQTKSFGRPGMGPCQGRFCGLTVSALIADKLEVHPDAVGYYRVRPPIKPITLGELRQLRPQIQSS